MYLLSYALTSMAVLCKQMAAWHSKFVSINYIWNVMKTRENMTCAFIKSKVYLILNILQNLFGKSQQWCLQWIVRIPSWLKFHWYLLPFAGNSVIWGNRSVWIGYRGHEWQIKAETKWPPFSRRHFQLQFLALKWLYLIQNSLKFIRNGRMYNNSALVEIMAWDQTSDKPLAEPTV